MGLFKKKHDPFSQRAADLNEQIAALEEQIKQLTEEQAAANQAPAVAPVAPAQPAPTQPRLRSTAKPRGTQPAAGSSPAAVPEPAAAPRPQEPIFEEVDQERIQVQQEEATSGDLNGLGVRKYDLVAFWRRLTAHFRGPSTTNPKLVSYLAAGSIQGLRPMRYEKRVARNRFLLLAFIIALVLWGLVSIYLKKS